MELNSLAEIVACINKWQEIRNDSQAVLSVLTNVESFIFRLKTPAVENLHVYPGVSPTTGNFYIFLIPKEEDKAQSDSQLFDAIIQTRIQVFTNDADNIPETEAKRRIENWDNDRTTWIPAQVTSEFGIFKAFNLPSSYMEKGAEYRSFFALKNNDAVSSLYDADIITTNNPPKMVISYHDFVRPVPPFGGSLAESMFYLLQL